MSRRVLFKDRRIRPKDEQPESVIPQGSQMAWKTNGRNHVGIHFNSLTIMELPGDVKFIHPPLVQNFLTVLKIHDIITPATCSMI
jgi:hypothetical protein